MRLPCKQTQAGALPAASTISLRGTRPKHREKPHKLLQVGATPTPATSFGRRSGCRSVKPVSQNEPEATTGALPAPPTILDPWLNQQSAPLSAGELRVQVSSDPPDLTVGRRPGTARPASKRTQAPGAPPNRAGANSAWCSSHILRPARSERRCNSCRAAQFFQNPQPQDIP